MFDFLTFQHWSGIAGIVGVASLIFAIWKNQRKTASDKSAIQGSQPEVLTLANRFVEIFISHDIVHSQIPRYVGGISLKDLTTNEKLVAALDAKIISDTCHKFNVQQDWLEGKNVPIYSTEFFDKQLQLYIDFLVQLKKNHDSIECFAIKCPEDKLFDNNQDYDIALLFRGNLEGWTQSDGEPIWRYYPLRDYNFWGYKRSRIQLKTMIAIAHLFKIHVYGCHMSQEEIGNIREGYIFPGPLMQNKTMVAWHPEDYMFCEISSFEPHDKEEAIVVRNLIGSDWIPYLNKYEVVNKDLLAQIYLQKEHPLSLAY